MKKTMGWFRTVKTVVLSAVMVLSATAVSESWALNIDFEKELKKREIVSVRLSDELGSRKDASTQNVVTAASSANQAQAPQGEDLDLTPDRETESFSVQLKAISR